MSVVKVRLLNKLNKQTNNSNQSAIRALENKLTAEKTPRILYLIANYNPNHIKTDQSTFWFLNRNIFPLLPENYV